MYNRDKQKHKNVMHTHRSEEVRVTLLWNCCNKQDIETTLSDVTIIKTMILISIIAIIIAIVVILLIIIIIIITKQQHMKPKERNSIIYKYNIYISYIYLYMIYIDI